MFSASSHEAPFYPSAAPTYAPAEFPNLAVNEEEEAVQTAYAHNATAPPPANGLDPTDDIIELPHRPASLAFHPIAEPSLARGRPNLRPHLDPVTEALALRAQQAYRGEPTSPLSPRTLQRLAAAVARGMQDPFRGENITAADVLAPPPLAIGWYPRNPITMHAERKRGLNAMTAEPWDAETLAAGVGADGGVDPFNGSFESPYKRARHDDAAGSAALPSASSSVLVQQQPSSAPACEHAAARAFQRRKRQRDDGNGENGV